VQLSRIKPTIWRRLALLDNMSLGILHWVIQVAFGWEFEHLHSFLIDEVRYEEKGFDYSDAEDENEVTLAEVITREKQKFLYIYDFGDNWEDKIVAEKFLPVLPGRFPACVGGARACPPEDCGGPFGYYDFLDAQTTTTPTAAQLVLREWYDGKFDPEHFDMDAVNERLHGKARFLVQD
jgi:hypothetical protein